MAKATRILGKTAKQSQIKYSNINILILSTNLFSYCAQIQKLPFRGDFSIASANFDRRLLLILPSSALALPMGRAWDILPHLFYNQHTQISLHLQQVQILTKYIKTKRTMKLNDRDFPTGHNRFTSGKSCVCPQSRLGTSNETEERVQGPVGIYSDHQGQ